MTANPGPQIASMIEYLPVDLPIANEKARELDWIV